mgnify:CR=1 FL=1
MSKETNEATIQKICQDNPRLALLPEQSALGKKSQVKSQKNIKKTNFAKKCQELWGKNPQMKHAAKFKKKKKMQNPSPVELNEPVLVTDSDGYLSAAQVRVFFFNIRGPRAFGWFWPTRIFVRGHG